MSAAFRKGYEQYHRELEAAAAAEPMFFRDNRDEILTVACFLAPSFFDSHGGFEMGLRHAGKLIDTAGEIVRLLNEKTEMP